MTGVCSSDLLLVRSSGKTQIDYATENGNHIKFQFNEENLDSETSVEIVI